MTARYSWGKLQPSVKIDARCQRGYIVLGKRGTVDEREHMSNLITRVRITFSS